MTPKPMPAMPRPGCFSASRTITASWSTIPATGATAAIDAPEAAPVEAALAATGWKLTDILVTHHHGDHTAGIAELKRRHRCRVVAPRQEAAKIPDVDVTVGEGDTVKVGDAHGAGDRDARPHARPDQLFLPRRQAAVCRRHPVLDRLRPGDRGHAGDDVAVAAQAARAAGRHQAFLRPRIHRRQYPLRA